MGLAADPGTGFADLFSLGAITPPEPKPLGMDLSDTAEPAPPGVSPGANVPGARHQLPAQQPARADAAPADSPVRSASLPGQTAKPTFVLHIPLDPSSPSLVHAAQDARRSVSLDRPASAPLPAFAAASVTRPASASPARRPSWALAPTPGPTETIPDTSDEEEPLAALLGGYGDTMASPVSSPRAQAEPSPRQKPTPPQQHELQLPADPPIIERAAGHASQVGAMEQQGGARMSINAHSLQAGRHLPEAPLQHHASSVGKTHQNQVAEGASQDGSRAHTLPNVPEPHGSPAGRRRDASGSPDGVGMGTLVPYEADAGLASPPAAPRIQRQHADRAGMGSTKALGSQAAPLDDPQMAMHRILVSAEAANMTLHNMRLVFLRRRTVQALWNIDELLHWAWRQEGASTAMPRGVLAGSFVKLRVTADECLLRQVVQAAKEEGEEVVYVQGEEEAIPVSCLSDRMVEESEVEAWRQFMQGSPQLQQPCLVQVARQQHYLKSARDFQEVTDRVHVLALWKEIFGSSSKLPADGVLQLEVRAAMPLVPQLEALLAAAKAVLNPEALASSATLGQAYQEQATAAIPSEDFVPPLPPSSDADAPDLPRSCSRSKGVRRQGQHPSRSKSRSPTRHDGRRDKRRRFASSPPSGRRLLRSEKSPAGDRALDRDRNRSRSAGTHRPDRKAHPFPGGAREVSPLDAPLEDSADEPPKPYMPHRSPPRGRKRSRGDSPAARKEDNLPKTPKQQDVHGADRPENEPEGRMERGGQEARLSSLKKGKSKADGQGTRTKASKKQPKKGSRGEPEVQTPGAGITDATEGQLRKHARIEAPPKRPSSPRQTDLGDISRKSRDSHKPSEAPDADAQDDLPNSSKAESSRDAAQKEQRGEDAASRDRAANPDGAAPRGHRSPSQERGTPGHAHKHGSDAETPSHVRTSDSGRNGNGQQSASVPGKTNLIFAHPERQACSKLPESVVSKSPADATSARVRFPMASQAPSPQEPPMLPWEPQDPPADPRPACPGAAAAPSAAAPSPSPASKGLGKTPGSLKGIKPNRMFDREEILERRRTGSGHPPAKDARPGRDPQPDHLISPPRAPRQIHDGSSQPSPGNMAGHIAALLAADDSEVTQALRAALALQPAQKDTQGTPSEAFEAAALQPSPQDGPQEELPGDFPAAQQPDAAAAGAAGGVDAEAAPAQAQQGSYTDWTAYWDDNQDPGYSLPVPVHGVLLTWFQDWQADRLQRLQLQQQAYLQQWYAQQYPAYPQQYAAAMAGFVQPVAGYQAGGYPAYQAPYAAYSAAAYPAAVAPAAAALAAACSAAAAPAAEAAAAYPAAVAPAAVPAAAEEGSQPLPTSQPPAAAGSDAAADQVSSQPSAITSWPPVPGESVPVGSQAPAMPQEGQEDKLQALGEAAPELAPHAGASTSTPLTSTRNTQPLQQINLQIPGLDEAPGVDLAPLPAAVAATAAAPPKPAAGSLVHASAPATSTANPSGNMSRVAIPGLSPETPPALTPIPEGQAASRAASAAGLVEARATSRDSSTRQRLKSGSSQRRSNLSRFLSPEGVSARLPASARRSALQALVQPDALSQGAPATTAQALATPSDPRRRSSAAAAAPAPVDAPQMVQEPHPADPRLESRPSSATAQQSRRDQPSDPRKRRHGEVAEEPREGHRSLSRASPDRRRANDRSTSSSPRPSKRLHRERRSRSPASVEHRDHLRRQDWHTERAGGSPQMREGRDRSRDPRPISSRGRSRTSSPSHRQRSTSPTRSSFRHRSSGGRSQEIEQAQSDVEAAAFGRQSRSASGVRPPGAFGSQARGPPEPSLLVATDDTEAVSILSCLAPPALEVLQVAAAEGLFGCPLDSHSLDFTAKQNELGQKLRIQNMKVCTLLAAASEATSQLLQSIAPA
ncbi:hypothetical protein WJX84_010685 [Apatococcus fuscideae]|uniref:Uncharacterized protein n=1 Tax=Apatococcus fuscideae TaxID=2026836 RepID=A0AAW1T720_9CHLO